jgi:hypothetical protein
MNSAGYQILNNRAFGILGQDAHVRVNLLALRNRRQNSDRSQSQGERTDGVLQLSIHVTDLGLL